MLFEGPHPQISMLMKRIIYVGFHFIVLIVFWSLNADVTLIVSPISSYPLIFSLSHLSSANNIIQVVIHNLKCFTWLTCKFACFCAASKISNVDCILNCDQESIFLCLPDSEAHLHLPMVVSTIEIKRWHFLLLFCFHFWKLFCLLWLLLARRQNWTDFPY